MMTDAIIFIASVMQVGGMIAGGICFLGLLAGGDKNICFPVIGVSGFVFLASTGLVQWVQP